jgi:DNA-binding response OmpR family regulator
MESFVEELKEQGFQVEFCSRADEAVTWIRTPFPFDAIILDVMMPAGSAFEGCDTEDGTGTGKVVYAKIRQVLPDIPVLIFTNLSSGIAGEYFEGDPQCRYVEKPEYVPSTFVPVVRAFLEVT